MSGHYESAIVKATYPKSINLSGAFYPSRIDPFTEVSKVYKVDDLQIDTPITEEEAYRIADMYDLIPNKKYNIEAFRLGLAGYNVTLPYYKTTEQKYTSEGLYRLRTGKKNLVHRGIALSKSPIITPSSLLGFFKNSKPILNDFNPELEQKLGKSNTNIMYFKALNSIGKTKGSIYLFNYYTTNLDSNDKSDFIYANKPMGYVNLMKEFTTEEQPNSVEVERLYYYLVAGVIPD